jgi:hypothetical protein
VFDNDGTLWSEQPVHFQPMFAIDEVRRTAPGRPAPSGSGASPLPPCYVATCARRWPLAAFGNSDGDLQMLQWTAAGEGGRLCVLVRHDDAAREWAYDRDSRVGRPREALDEASTRGWTAVSMAHDWATVFPGQAVQTSP